ncbi:dTDP-4-dehydrorhamnose reductase [Morganella morganii subsp. morganii]|nr:dTDP-4-dehydrorhamnose reductase [Morganella morganii subsp. morganii]
MKILLFGKNGQVGWELQRSLAPLGEIIALDSQSNDFHANFLEPEKLSETIEKIQPDIIVNAAAYTAVDNAEKDQENAYTINSDSVCILAKIAKKHNIWLVHYSTDYIFNGNGNNYWKENDKPAPLNIYGLSKLQGEYAIVENCHKYIIFRTSWVYAAKGNNFAKTMLNLGKIRSELSVIDDQYGVPTSAELLADCTCHAIRQALLNPNIAGIYHLVPKGETNWYEYAKLIFNEAKKLNYPLTIEHLHPIPATQYPLPAKRPYNSRLDTQKFEDTFKLNLPNWKDGVIRLIHELIQENKK